MLAIEEVDDGLKPRMQLLLSGVLIRHFEGSPKGFLRKRLALDGPFSIH
jgi:hypothetical protein